jgi:hypothetical protein
MNKFVLLSILTISYFSIKAQENKFHFSAEIGVSKTFTITNYSYYQELEKPLRLTGEISISKEIKENILFQLGLGYLNYKFKGEPNYVLIDDNNAMNDPDRASLNEYYYLLTIPLRFKWTFDKSNFFILSGINNKIFLAYRRYIEGENTNYKRKDGNHTLYGNRYLPSLEFGLGYRISLFDKLSLYTSIKNNTDLLNEYPKGWFKKDYLIINTITLQTGVTF